MTHAAAFASHLPLLGFTWALLLGSGLALGAALPDPALPPRLLFGAALLLSGAGGLMSFLHLGQKARAPFALRGFAHSWLSREAAVAGAFSTCLGFVLAFGTAWGALAAASALALACSIALLYRLEAQPRWASLPALAGPVLSVLLLAILVSGRPVALLGIVGALDASAALLRIRRTRRPDPGTLPEFPALTETCRRIRILRLVLSSGALLFGFTDAPLPALGLQALALFLDRFDFYADAHIRSPRAEMAALKARRMAEALGLTSPETR